MSALNFNTVDLSFDLFMVLWGLWGYWRKEGGPHRRLFLMMALLAALASGLQFFELGTIGRAAVLGLHWLLVIIVVLALLSIVKYERPSN